MNDCVKQTVKAEGLGGLYKGIMSPILGQMAFNATQFLLYGQVTDLVSSKFGYKKNEPLEVKHVALSGALVGFGVAFVEAPQDLFKSQLQVQVFRKRPLFDSLFGCVRYLGGNYGIRGIYQGLGATICRNTCAVSLYFGVYEWSRREIAKRQNIAVKDLSTLSILLAGGAGGAAYWGVTFPLDVVKSSMQGDSPNKGKRKYKSVFDAVRKLYASGGLRQFYKGFTPCMIRSVPANAVCFLGYQYTKDNLTRLAFGSE